MNWELDAILDQSITQIAEGKARVESCLLAYPAQADELRPLLVLSEQLLDVPKPVLAPEARARIESQLLTAAAAGGLVRRERKRLRLPRLRLPVALPRWRWAYSALAAVVIVVMLLSGTLVGAANALPGSALYPVKLATEDVWLWVAPARDEPALHLRFAQRRLEEYQELAERGVYDESILDAMVAHVDAALAGIEELPPAIALVLLDQAEEVVTEQRQVLTFMLSDLPAASRVRLDSLLGLSLAQITRMQAMRWALLPYATVTAPLLNLTPVPEGTLEPGGAFAATSSPTATPAPGETEELLEATATETSGGTSATVSVGTTPTATSEPGVTPTATSEPGVTPSSTPETPEEEPTKKTPPGLTKTAEPPAWGLTKTPDP